MGYCAAGILRKYHQTLWPQLVKTLISMRAKVSKYGGGYHQWEVSAEEAVTFRKVSTHDELKMTHGCSHAERVQYTGRVHSGGSLCTHGTLRQNNFAFDLDPSIRVVEEYRDSDICHPGVSALLLHPMPHRQDSNVHAHLDLLARAPKWWFLC